MDACDHDGWAVTWSGWFQPSNQLIIIGFWRAVKGDVMRRITTLGKLDYFGAMEGGAYVRADDSWPWLGDNASERERAIVKERARVALLAAIDAEQTSAGSAESTL